MRTDTFCKKSFGWDVKPLVPCVVVTHIKEPSVLIEKRRGPGLIGDLFIAPQHIVNHYMVL